MNNEEPPKKFVIGTFCCKCDFKRSDLKRPCPGQDICEGCGHNKCGYCGFIEGYDNEETVIQGGYPKESGKEPAVVILADCKPCLYCRKRKVPDQMAMKRITRRVYDQARQKQRVVTEEMGPFCLARYQGNGPPCGECYQMSCEG